ncbi:MAG: hypothetical protein EA376_07580 [Phycisphaeraceae bacterium]|nr:MAG: hypothetical protein EA376_07580 [Phycisphaeraceae bacterium]
MNANEIILWADHLERLAAQAATDRLDRAPAPRGFLAWRGVIENDDSAQRSGAEPRLDELLWSAVCRPEELGASLDQALPERSDPGPLFPQSASAAIEVWTERDLCGLHALERLARQRRRDDWSRLVQNVARWHLEHTQPDNATNRPWALHVFLLLSHESDPPDPEPRLYAETLLHNCMVMQGRPDPLGALILIDAAATLREAIGAR